MVQSLLRRNLYSYDYNGVANENGFLISHIAVICWRYTDGAQQCPSHIIRINHWQHFVLCIERIDAWMSSNWQRMNANKTQLLWLGTRQQLNKLSASDLQVLGTRVSFSGSVSNFGVIIASQLSMSDHVSSLYVAYQWRVSQVVLVYGLHRLDVWSCQECWRQPASGASASTVPQSWTAYRLLCATTVFHWTSSRGSWRLICLDSNARHPAPLRRFVTLVPSINAMTYLLAYFCRACFLQLRQLR